MLRSFINGLIDLVYPKVCLACKKKLAVSSVDKIVCVECWEKINKNTPPFCRRCGRQLKDKRLERNICHDCVKKPFHFDRAFSACSYDGVIKELIREFKYKKKDYLGATLSRLMIEFIKEYSLPMEVIDYIVPVPLHETRIREREFNQAHVLSSHIASEFRKELLHDGLIRHRPTRIQAELGGEERFLNVKGSFSVKKPAAIKAKNILLVDDVLTTGATSSEAACALKKDGANIVFVLTLAN